MCSCNDFLPLLHFLFKYRGECWMFLSHNYLHWCWGPSWYCAVVGFTLVWKIISTKINLVHTLAINQITKYQNIDFYWNLWYRLHLYFHNVIPYPSAYDINLRMFEKTSDKRPLDIINFDTVTLCLGFKETISLFGLFTKFYLANCYKHFDWRVTWKQTVENAGWVEVGGELMDH